MMSMSGDILNILFDGSDKLSPKSHKAVAEYIKSREAVYGGFFDKAENVDIYYTFFGLMCSLALGLELNKYHKDYLKGIEPENLETINRIAYLQSCNLLKIFAVPVKFRRMATKSAISLGSFDGFSSSAISPLADMSPYGICLSMMAPESVPGKEALRQWLTVTSSSYKTIDGGWTNIPGNSKATLNATVAALLIQRMYYSSFKNNTIIAEYKDIDTVDNRALMWLKSQQIPIGGFLAAPGAPVPDLLSTATALTALKLYNTRPCYVAADFIQNHWRNDGGFSSTFMDEDTDCEYTFYGLLALGALQMPTIGRRR